MEMSEMTQEQVFSKFPQGVSCAMQVLSEAAPMVGLDEGTACRLASGFGAGMRCGGVCGCVTAAYMALGLGFGNDGPLQPEKVQALNEKKEEFNRRFKEIYGSLVCPEILGGLDPAIPEQKAQIAEKGLMLNTCARAVLDTCDILEELLD